MKRMIINGGEVEVEWHLLVFGREVKEPVSHAFMNLAKIF